MKARTLNLPYWLIVVLVVFGLLFAWDATQRVLSNLQLNAEDVWLDKQVAIEEARNKELTTLKESVQTDSWVERFVRTVWHWARPDETVVLPRTLNTPVPNPSTLSPASSTPTAPTDNANAPVEKSWLEKFLDWLFGPAQ